MGCAAASIEGIDETHIPRTPLIRPVGHLLPARGEKVAAAAFSGPQLWNLSHPGNGKVPSPRLRREGPSLYRALSRRDNSPAATAPLDIAENPRHLFHMIKLVPQTRSYFWLFL